MMAIAVDQPFPLKPLSKYSSTLDSVSTPSPFHETTVYKWVSDSHSYESQDPKIKNVINKLKAFLNCPEWKVLVVIHKKDCAIKENLFNYGSHLHILLKADFNELGRNSKYRNLYRAFSTFDGLSKGYCRCDKVRNSPSGLLQYFQKEDKYFLGTNDPDLLQMYTEAEHMQRIDHFSLDNEDFTDGFDAAPVQPLYDTGASCSTSICELSQPISTSTIPKSLTNKRHGDETLFLMDCLKKNPQCQTLTALSNAYEENTPEWSALINILSNSSLRNLFQVARSKIDSEMETTTPMECILNLKDDLPSCLNVRQSVAVFNKWCDHQMINARKLYIIFHLLLSAGEKKRVGLYLHGESNSGKTYLTLGVFKQLAHIVGQVSKDNFPFQDLGGKKVVVGEEVSITNANVDKWKTLLSGEKTPVERKNKCPAFCSPSLVLLSSNHPLRVNIAQTEVKAIENRMFIFENLKRSPFLAEINHNIHPKIFTVDEPPSQDETLAILQNQTLPTRLVKIIATGEVPMYNDTLDELNSPEVINREVSTEEVEASGAIYTTPKRSSSYPEQPPKVKRKKLDFEENNENDSDSDDDDDDSTLILNTDDEDNIDYDKCEDPVIEMFDQLLEWDMVHVSSHSQQSTENKSTVYDNICIADNSFLESCEFLPSSFAKRDDDERMIVELDTHSGVKISKLAMPPVYRDNSKVDTVFFTVSDNLFQYNYNEDFRVTHVRVKDTMAPFFLPSSFVSDNMFDRMLLNFVIKATFNQMKYTNEDQSSVVTDENAVFSRVVDIAVFEDCTDGAFKDVAKVAVSSATKALKKLLKVAVVKKEEEFTELLEKLISYFVSVIGDCL